MPFGGIPHACNFSDFATRITRWRFMSSCDPRMPSALTKIYPSKGSGGVIVGLELIDT